MAKELPFFKFEIAEWMFGRIQKQPEAIQGMFVNLCCKYWHKLGEYTYKDACLDYGQDRIDILKSSEIIGLDGAYLYVKFLDIQLDECNKLSEKNSINGLKSAEARRLRKLTTVQPNSTTVDDPSTEAQRLLTEEKRIEEKRKEEESFNLFWNKYGKKVDRRDCEKKWAKLSIEIREKIMVHLDRYISATPDLKFRRDPATYLNNQTWENEIPLGNDSSKRYSPGPV